jgi:glucose-1-phosphate thymidylyltransferase
MRGIVLCGGIGSRLLPTSLVVNKHLMPLYDKPMIYYPIATLMTAGIREIAIISNPESIDSFSELLGNGNQFGVNLSYLTQNKPGGIAQAFLIAENFIGDNSSALILGDNFFHGSGLGRALSVFSNIDGASVFAYPVSNPQDYGVVELKHNKVISIKEKPSTTNSNLAVTGLYFYDKTVVERTKKLKPSSRGELEITSVNASYLQDNKLKVNILQRGTTWLDTGTPKQLHDASSYVRVIQDRQGFYIACLEEIALIHNWISEVEIKKSIKKFKNSDYSKYKNVLFFSRFIE